MKTETRNVYNKKNNEILEILEEIKNVISDIEIDMETDNPTDFYDLRSSYWLQAEFQSLIDMSGEAIDKFIDMETILKHGDKVSSKLLTNE